MNKKPEVGSIWVFDDWIEGDFHFLLLKEKTTAWSDSEWAFETLVIETGERTTGYFCKHNPNYNGWQEDK